MSSMNSIHFIETNDWAMHILSESGLCVFKNRIKRKTERILTTWEPKNWEISKTEAVELFRMESDLRWWKIKSVLDSWM